MTFPSWAGTSVLIDSQAFLQAELAIADEEVHGSVGRADRMGEHVELVAPDLDFRVDGNGTGQIRRGYIVDRIGRRLGADVEGARLPGGRIQEGDGEQRRAVGIAGGRELDGSLGEVESAGLGGPEFIGAPKFMPRLRRMPEKPW